jgi:hypothetical protein
MSARFELGRTHLALAALAQHQHDREAASAHITAAHRLFIALCVPMYVERTMQHAQALGLSLSSSQAPT